MIKNLFINKYFINILLVLFTVSLSLANFWVKLYNVSEALLFISMGISIYAYKNRNCPSKSIIIGYFVFIGSFFITGFLQSNEKDLIANLRFIQYTLAFWPIYYFGQWKEFKRSILIGLSLGIMIVIVASYYIGSGNAASHRYIGLFLSPNYTATILEFMLPFLALSIYKIRALLHRFLGILMLIIGYILLVLTESRGAILGTVITLILLILYFLWTYKKRVYFALILLVLIAASILMEHTIIHAFSRAYDQERILLWHSSIQMWLNHFWYGVGFAQWNQVYRLSYISPMAKEPLLTHSHNSILYMLSAGGIIGFLGYITLIISHMWYGICLVVRKIDKQAGLVLLFILISTFIHGFVDRGLIQKMTLILYFAYVGYISAGGKTVKSVL